MFEGLISSKGWQTNTIIIISTSEKKKLPMEPLTHDIHTSKL